ncbi:MAG: glycosyltransferase [Alphaproteobacteria bacterium]|nr:glycosyltransferase [Alphaproteobacteria bacterium]
MSVIRQLNIRDAVPVAAPQAQPGPLKVGVLVDLALTSDAGGHVKCWQRLAEAAAGYGDRLDLTVHFNGPQSRCIELSPSVRYVLLPPVFSTARVIRHVPDHTDLAPWHPRLAQRLSGYDVIHTTDAFFCYARTAARFARRRGVPIVSSIHTNTPEYARITAARLLERALGRGMMYRVANDGLALPNRVSGLLERRLVRHLENVTFAMGSYGGGPDTQYAARHSGVSLRRGLDRALFSPARRDRAWFEARFGLPREHLILMYAGKLNTGKNVPLLAPVVRQAREAGVATHLFCAGAGSEREALEAALGDAVTCPGPLPQPELARAYASADLFLFPSMIDESGNAAVEALASGLPTLLAAGNGIASRMADCAGLWVLPGDRPEPWAAAIAELAAMPQRRGAMSRAARAYVETSVPSWADVLIEDLLPVWQRAAARAAA